MGCSEVREALSADLDGEAAALSAEQVAAHLRRCGSCRAWQQRAVAVGRRVRVGGPLPPSDLSEQVVAAVAARRQRERARRLWSAVAVMVGLSGILQLAVSVPLLALRSTVGGAWLLALEGLVAASFFLGAVVLLWHDRRKVEPLAVLPVAAADAKSSNDRRAS